jgi:tetratricopeptide (TPR) repeat protein
MCRQLSDCHTRQTPTYCGAGHNGQLKAMVPAELLNTLGEYIQERRIGKGIALLDQERTRFDNISPDGASAGLALSSLAQWLDVGFQDRGTLAFLLKRFDQNARQNLPLAEYIHLRMAEALVAMREEELTTALYHLDTVLMLGNETADRKVTLIATLWKARCLRKAGEYEQSLKVTRQGMDLAASLQLWPIRAVMQTLESWILFQNGELKEAVRILREAETVLRETDDFITLGNIQSTYGRIALREGRYDHAMQYFEASIEYFKHRESLSGYLARSLTNIAQAKRFLALQLRHSMDAHRERQKRTGMVEDQRGKEGKAGQLERMYELLQSAQKDLAEADCIYKKAQNHHGAGNADVNLAQIYLDLGNLDQAEECANEAFELGATKADHLLMCRARIVQASVANARYEDEIGEDDDPSRFAQIAHDCAKEAVDYGERTQSRRLLAQAYICRGLTLVNGFFNESETARVCCDKAASYLGHDRHDALWQELEMLRERILHGGVEDPNLRAWSQGAVGDKSLQEVVGQFEELLIRKVWEHEGRKVSRVAQRLAVSPKKVRRVLRHLGVLIEPA